jgi:hypothetical protein
LITEQYREEDEDHDKADIDDIAPPVECGEPAAPLNCDGAATFGCGLGCLGHG